MGCFLHPIYFFRISSFYLFRISSLKNKTVICHLSLTNNTIYSKYQYPIYHNAHYGFINQIRVTCFTPFTALSFLIRASSRDVSSMLTTRFPLKSPSLLSILILRSVSFSSLLMILVRLFTMPISSLPTTRSVIEYIDVPLPLHLALTMR